jgi:hypothetical protein
MTTDSFHRSLDVAIGRAFPTATDADYLTGLPWFAVVPPDEPTPIHDAVKADLAVCWCGASGVAPCVTKSGRATTPHSGRGA